MTGTKGKDILPAVFDSFPVLLSFQTDRMVLFLFFLMQISFTGIFLQAIYLISGVFPLEVLFAVE